MAFPQWREYFVNVLFGVAFACGVILTAAMMGVFGAGLFIGGLIVLMDACFGIPKYLFRLFWLPSFLIAVCMMMVAVYLIAPLLGLSFNVIDVLRFWDGVLLLVGGVVGETLFSKLLQAFGSNLSRPPR